jgi:hypothetical protein
MSVHDRAAARYVRRFTLTVCLYFRGCAQYLTFEGLTEHGVEDEKRLQRRLLPAGYEIAFEVY